MKKIWHVSVDPLKHCFRWQFSFPMEFFQSQRETFSQKLYIILPYCFAKKQRFSSLIFNWSVPLQMTKEMKYVCEDIKSCRTEITGAISHSLNMMYI